MNDIGNLQPLNGAFEYLPDEVALNILGHMDDPRQVAALAGVNRRFYALAHDPQLWIEFLRKKIDILQLPKDSDPYQTFKEVSMVWPLVSRIILADYIREHRQLFIDARLITPHRFPYPGELEFELCRSILVEVARQMKLYKIASGVEQGVVEQLLADCGLLGVASTSSRYRAEFLWIAKGIAEKSNAFPWMVVEQGCLVPENLSEKAADLIHFYSCLQQNPKAWIAPAASTAGKASRNATCRFPLEQVRKEGEAKARGILVKFDRSYNEFIVMLQQEYAMRKGYYLEVGENGASFFAEGSLRKYILGRQGRQQTEAMAALVNEACQRLMQPKWQMGKEQPDAILQQTFNL